MTQPEYTYPAPPTAPSTQPANFPPVYYGPPPVKSRRKLKIAAAIALPVLAGLVTVIVLNSSGGSSSPTGFNDPDVLSADITQTINLQLADPTDPKYDPSESVTDTTCIKDTGPKFTCIATWDDGTETTMVATVTANGDSWITS